MHCTATREGQWVSVADIDRWHRQRGFRCIGYHFVVLLDGTMCKGREIDEVGAHCKGHNAHSIGVCYVGGLSRDGKPKDTRTQEHRTALWELLTELREQFPQAIIHSHKDFARKACPCFDATKEYESL